MGSIRLSHMTMGDVDAVAQLERMCFSDPWPRDNFINELNNIAAHYLLMWHDGEIISYGGMWIIFDEAHVTNVAVHPVMRRRGYGEVMMRALMRLALRQGAARMTLEVREGNIAAKRMYEKLDFFCKGLRKSYYADGENAIIMWNDDIAATGDLTAKGRDADAN